MRACVYADPKLSPAMARVAEALQRYAPPELEFTPAAELADLVVLHVIGYPETAAAVEELRARGQRYAIMQYCMRSTQEPNTLNWLDIWRGAEAVWSYYDLDALLVEDGYAEQLCPWCREELPHVGQGTGAIDFPRCFYFAPLGVDLEAFEPLITIGERFAMLTSGYVAESECVAECTQAAARVGRRVFHLGPALECHRNIDNVEQRHGITDDELARAYSRCDYVAGMRRCEGFEMPAAEGLCCGARPMMLDRPHYRQWFAPWAVFVPELAPDLLTDSIAAVLANDVTPVSLEELEAARKFFDWRPLVAGFWQRALHNIEVIG